MKKLRARLSCGALAGVGLVSLVALGAAPAQAVSSDPLTPPPGWYGTSDSAPYFNGEVYWNQLLQYPDGSSPELVDNTSPETRVVADTLYVDAWHSRDRITAVGEAVDFEVVMRRLPSPMFVEPSLYPGAYLRDEYKPKQFSLTLNLRDTADNVSALTTEDFRIDAPGVTVLSHSYNPDTMLFVATVELPNGVDEARVRFSAAYSGTGNDTMGVNVNVGQYFMSYGALVNLNLAIPIAAPSFDVFKSADVDSVAEAGDEITYTVTIDRTAGSADRRFTFTDDMTDVLKDAGPFTAADITMPAELSATPVVTDTGFTFEDAWPTDPATGEPVPSLDVSYTVAYDGASSDSALVNTACVTGIMPAPGSPNAPAEGSTQEPVCDDASVAVTSAAPPVDPSTPPVDPAGPTDPNPPSAPGGPEGALAATGSELGGALTAAGVLLAAGTLLAGRARRGRRA